jgi:hypothetical protein
MYYYTRQRPAEETAPSHATVYVERPVPSIGGVPLTSADVDEVLARLTRRQQHAERLQKREQVFQSQVREFLRANLVAGDVPNPEVVAAVERLTGLQDEALESLYEREKTFASILDGLRASVGPFGLEGGLSLVSPAAGCWDDGWVGRSLHVRLRSARAARGVVVHGMLPPAAGSRQELSVRFKDADATKRIASGAFEYALPGMLAAGEETDLEVTASNTFCPKAHGLSDDRRELSWLLRRITATPV